MRSFLVGRARCLRSRHGKCAHRSGIRFRRLLPTAPLFSRESDSSRLRRATKVDRSSWAADLSRRHDLCMLGGVNQGRAFIVGKAMRRLVCSEGLSLAALQGGTERLTACRERADA